MFNMTRVILYTFHTLNTPNPHGNMDQINNILFYFDNINLCVKSFFVDIFYFQYNIVLCCVLEKSRPKLSDRIIENYTADVF